MKTTMFKLTLAALLSAALLAGCSDDSSDAKDAGGDTELNLTITGTVEEGDSTDISGSLGKPSDKAKDRALSVSNLKLYCVTFVDPPSAGTGDIGTDGSFSVTIENGKDAAFGCFVRQNDVTVASLVFEDTASLGFGGTNSRSGTISLSNSSSLGTVVLDLQRGLAVADIAQITNLTGTKGNFDFTGTWVMDRLPTTPAGYSALPTTADCGGNCDGPHVGMSVDLVRMVGKIFKPDAACQSAVDNDTFNPASDTCNGTVTSTPVHGIQVWQSSNARTTCGNRLGITDNEARAFGGVAIDLAASGGNMSFGPHTWQVTSPGGLTIQSDGWRINEATAGNAYMDVLGLTVISNGALCSTNTGSQLYEDQCYANYIENNIQRKDDNNCIAKVNYNWGAGESNPGDFVQTDGPGVAETEFVFEKFNYTNDNSGTFSQTETWHEWADDGGTGGASCEVVNSFTMSVTKTGDSTLIADMQINKVVSGYDGNKNPNTLCKAANMDYIDSDKETTAIMFKMTRQ